MSRTAIVTGASRGIGLAIAERLARENYNVVGCARTPGTAVRALEALPGTAIGVDADISQPKGAERLVETATNQFGGVDVVVNNAGIFLRRSFLEVTPAEWSEMMAINLTGVFLISQAAARAMINTGAAERGGGRIVNIASVAGIVSPPDSSPYNASKAAVISLTRSLAADLAPYGIVSTCVAPGWVDTGVDPFLEALGSEQRKRLNPQGRAGAPEDVAHAVAALCDTRAAFMNGAVVTVDGGALAVIARPT